MNIEEKKQIFTLTVFKGFAEHYLQEEQSKVLKTKIDFLVQSYMRNISKSVFIKILSFIKEAEINWLAVYEVNEKFTISLGIFFSDYWIKYFDGKNKYKKKREVFIKLKEIYENIAKDLYKDIKLDRKYCEKNNKKLFNAILEKIIY